MAFKLDDQADAALEDRPALTNGQRVDWRAEYGEWRKAGYAHGYALRKADERIERNT